MFVQRTVITKGELPHLEALIRERQGEYRAQQPHEGALGIGYIALLPLANEGLFRRDDERVTQVGLAFGSRIVAMMERGEVAALDRERLSDAPRVRLELAPDQVGVFVAYDHHADWTRMTAQAEAAARDAAQPSPAA